MQPVPMDARQKRTPSVVTTIAAASSGFPSPSSIQSPQGTFVPMLHDVGLRVGLDRLPARASPTQEDPKLRDLYELRRLSRLSFVPAVEGLSALRTAAAGRILTRERFLECFAALMRACSIEAPAEWIQNAIFDFFDRDRTNVVDNMELICGLLLFFSGTEEDKISAVFSAFDVNGGGYITIDELFTFLTSLFRVLLTPRVISGLHDVGIPVDTAEDLASMLSLDCFRTLGIELQGKLSLLEFRSWFYSLSVSNNGHCPYASLLQGLW